MWVRTSLRPHFDGKEYFAIAISFLPSSGHDALYVPKHSPGNVVPQPSAEGRDSDRHSFPPEMKLSRITPFIQVQQRICVSYCCAYAGHDGHEGQGVYIWDNDISKKTSLICLMTFSSSLGPLRQFCGQIFVARWITGGHLGGQC